MKELREMSDEDIIERHDDLANSTLIGTKHYLSELVRRDQDRQTKAMLSLTNKINIMTVVITICTVVITVFTIANAVIALILINK